MKDVIVYARSTCGYCRRAKALLERKGVAYEEIDIGAQPERRAEMIRRADGRSTVPQIFIGGIGVGGCDDLHALEAAGKLDSLLAAS